jgi:putative tryptophan/tyrosine transport system substrate-binding protein
MRRREFIAGLGAAAWPLVARAQQSERVRRIGVLQSGDENDPEAKRIYSAFTHALADLGWIDGRNVRMDLRWGGGDADRIRALAQELIGLQPDIILASALAAPAVQRETRTIPIVFVNVGDPVAGGIILRLDRPNGNMASATGKPRWEASGLSCSRRLRLGSSGPQSCSILTRSPQCMHLHLKWRPSYSWSSRSPRPFAAT